MCSFLRFFNEYKMSLSYWWFFYKKIDVAVIIGYLNCIQSTENSPEGLQLKRQLICRLIKFVELNTTDL